MEFYYRAVKKQKGDRVWYGIQKSNSLDPIWYDYFGMDYSTEEGVREAVNRLNRPSEQTITTVL